MTTETLPPEDAPAPEPEAEAGAQAAEPEPEPWPRNTPPLTRASRFLYVDIAARRAKQLRRGALPRLDGLLPDPETGERAEPGHKLERIAMREVDDGLIAYALPEGQDAEAG